MKTLYEKLLISNIDTHTKSALREAYFVKADNVSTYFYEIDGKDCWSPKDFPNVAPPFKNVFIEYRTPRFMNRGGIIESAPGWKSNPSSTGVFIQSIETDGKPDDLYIWGTRLNENRQASSLIEIAHREGARWMIFASLFINFADLPTATDTSCTFYFGVNPDGSIHDSLLFGVLMDRKMDSAWEAILQAFWTICGPALLAVSFMHCKNVVMVKQGPGTHPGKRNRHEPHVVHYTLEIEPMKKVLRTEGESEKTGIRRALHICRGHFKDYRKSGLFGKFKDVYWWDAHTRGTVAYGVVDKDYAVTNPKEK